MSNVFEDIGFDNADYLLKATLAKAKSREEAVGKLAEKIQHELNQIGGSEKSISDATGIKRTHVRRLLAGEFQKFCLSKLVDIALQIDMDIEVRVKKPKPSKPSTT